MAISDFKHTDWLWLYSTIGYIIPPPREVVFSEDHPPPSRLLFLFPTKRQHFEESRQVLKLLSHYRKRRIIQLAVPAVYRKQVKKPPHAVFFYPVTDHDPPRVKAEAILEHYRGRRFDAVINLEPEFDLRLARVVSGLRAPRRIGFTGPGADYLYNIQIETGPDHTPERAFEQILKLCELGEPVDLSEPEPRKQKKPKKRKKRHG